MDLPQLEQWDTDPRLHDATVEKIVIFRRLIVTLFVLIAGMFLLMLWVLGSPDSHRENAAALSSAATWPDGSAKTSHDWWANAAVHIPTQVAQPPAPGSPPGQPQPQHG